MKFPEDKENNLPNILDPKTPDLLDRVLADVVRNLLGMGYINAVDPATLLESQPTPSKASSPSPRDAIASFKTTPQTEDIAEIKKILSPFSATLFFPEQVQADIQKFFQLGVAEFQEQHHSWPFSKGGEHGAPIDDPLKPYPRLNQPTGQASSSNISPRAAIDKHSNSRLIDHFNPEPESLLDIFFNKNSPFNLLPEPLFIGEKTDLSQGLDDNRAQQNGVTTWSSISVVTSADGITKTRKTIRRADGTEETTETITSSHNNQQLPNKLDDFHLPSADPYRVQSITLPRQSPGLFDSLAKWWGQILA